MNRSTVFVVEFSDDCDSQQPIFTTDTWERAVGEIKLDAARRFPDVSEWEWDGDDSDPPELGGVWKSMERPGHFTCVTWFITRVEHHDG